MPQFGSSIHENEGNFARLVILGSWKETEMACKFLSTGKRNLSLREHDTLMFFYQLLEKTNAATMLFKRINPVYHRNWIASGMGKPARWLYRIRLSDAYMGCFTGGSDFNLARLRFEHFESRRQDIEDAFGEALIWDYRANRQVQHIGSFCHIGGLRDKSMWPEIQTDLVDRMVRLEKALEKHMAGLP